ncbi:MAG: type 1 glutamine amidotransferase domain-containing protein [Candidatus Eisenbacteria bacterium]|nr:type 1 glutamine amidotransferase domain-containing protein [Candidatus Eisenbacteria bacterium]
MTSEKTPDPAPGPALDQAPDSSPGLVGRILIFVEQSYEDLELWYPKIRLEEEGYEVVVAGPEKKTYTGKNGYPCAADFAITDINSTDFDGLVIPGGWAPDRLRRYPRVLELVREFEAAGKTIGMICHAGWVPISAGILKGRTVTGVSAIKDDLENAGATFVDRSVVSDRHLVSSRTPADLPDFLKGMIKDLKR